MTCLTCLTCLIHTSPFVAVRSKKQLQFIYENKVTLDFYVNSMTVSHFPRSSLFSKVNVDAILQIAMFQIRFLQCYANSSARVCFV